jgi:hypothetical protein
VTLDGEVGFFWASIAFEVVRAERRTIAETHISIALKFLSILGLVDLYITYIVVLLWKNHRTAAIDLLLMDKYILVVHAISEYLHRPSDHNSLCLYSSLLPSIALTIWMIFPRD